MSNNKQIILPRGEVKEANRASNEEKCKKMLDYWTDDNTIALKQNYFVIVEFKNKIVELKELYLKYKKMDDSQEIFGYCDIVYSVLFAHKSMLQMSEQVIALFNENLVNFGIILAAHLDFSRQCKRKPVWTAQEIASVKGNVAQLDTMYKIQMQSKMQQLQFTDICERLFDCILLCVGIKSTNDKIRKGALNEFFPEQINDPVELLDIHINMIDAILKLICIDITNMF